MRNSKQASLGYQIKRARTHSSPPRHTDPCLTSTLSIDDFLTSRRTPSGLDWAVKLRQSINVVYFHSTEIAFRLSLFPFCMEYLL